MIGDDSKSWKIKPFNEHPYDRYPTLLTGSQSINDILLCGTRKP